MEFLNSSWQLYSLKTDLSANAASTDESIPPENSIPIFALLLLIRRLLTAFSSNSSNCLLQSTTGWIGEGRDLLSEMKGTFNLLDCEIVKHDDISSND